MQHHAVIIVGGGQAGLSMSYCLKERGIDHVVLEKHRIGHAWRNQRWDSFCLVTPNWQCQLPGFPYPGPDPHGFMAKDEIVQYIEAYARHFNAPVQEGVTVSKVRMEGGNKFYLNTSAGEFTANQVVIATSGYHRPKIPAYAERLPATITQLSSSQYKSPEQLPEGGVLIVGTGQSGCQIAEDLHLAGRQVHLCVGGAPRSPRRYRGRDVVDWLEQMGYYDIPIDKHPQKEAVRDKTNHYLTGRDGGREIDLRRFALEGMKLYGRLTAVENDQLRFDDSLSHNLDQADAVAESIKRTIDQFISNQEIEAPIEPPYEPVWTPQETIASLDLTTANITTVIWAIGYDMDFSWVDVPVFNGKGYPCHDRGITAVEGFYFLGLPWLYTWGSGRFSGIARDAYYVADRIVMTERRKHSTQSLLDRSPLLEVINDMALGS
ncbi:flavin-dependent oxidoreductase [Leptolyngbya sp. BL0902]|uniref:MSMEG_0569 family flavin-dependent oxidoreductase n=1 Tax=Leptolyngbya sp. BL0902 TaxID=1115757 RepID=UPI0018E6F4C6|nr:MSMEG_0569 family flavin-dependent oxidoreductase [Leptolyngbya sp. BL0902]QQE66476.1 flavin-dependent oxidoreductase [Leptolyngbya sp. BL0902]